MSNHYVSTAKKFNELFIPAIAIFTGSVIALALLITYYTAKEDANAHKSNAHLVEVILDGWSENARLFALDYGIWDTAIENTILNPNQTWIEDNLHAGIKSTPVINGLLAITKDFEVLTYSQEDYIPFDIKPVLLKEIESIFKEIQMTSDKFSGGYRGRFFNNGLLVSYGLYPFTPESRSDGETLVFEENSSFLVIFKTSDELQLAQEGLKLNIGGLEFAEVTNDEQNQFVIYNSSGTPSIALKWHAAAPGTKLLMKFFPITVIVSLFLGLVVIVLYKRGTSIVHDINHREEKQQHFQSALADMSGLNFLNESKLEEEIGNILQRTSKVLDAENIGCWGISDDGTTANCLICYNPSTGKSVPRPSFSLTSLGIYSLEKDSRNISRHNDLAKEKPFSPKVHQVIKEYGINKVMTVRFYSEDKFLGILVAERTAKQNDFSEDEALFFRAISNILSLLLSIDIQRKLSEELKASKEIAEQANATKSAFLANMSHELRTPLNAIIGFAEVLDHSTDPKKNAEYTSLIHKSGSHLLDIVNDLLDLAKIESGKRELAETTTDIQHIWDGCAPIIMESAKNKNIELICQNFIEDKFVVDERIFKQIFMNILSNAIKFTEPGGTVTITSHRSPVDGIVIKFIDTGIGIKEADMDKVFQPFSQVESHLTKKHGGTGLGLPLVKSFIEMHQGSFTLESAHNVGTTAIITIPNERLIGNIQESSAQFI